MCRSFSVRFGSEVDLVEFGPQLSGHEDCGRLRERDAVLIFTVDVGPFPGARTPSCRYSEGMKSKAGAALFALIFALGFGAGGAFGIGSLIGQLNGWWQARHWHAVPATVLTADLKTSQGDSTTYSGHRDVSLYR